MQTDTHYQTTRNITLIGALINFLLGMMKTTLGLWGHSHALFADGVHSFSDLLTDFLVVLAAKYGTQAADLEHPYGHRRIETIATMLLSALLIVVGIGLAVDSINAMSLETQRATPNHFVLIAAIISVIANEGLFRYTLAYAKKLNSNLLRANAWHSRSDAWSSAVVLLGVAGAQFGYPNLDNYAAIIVALMIMKMGWNLGYPSIRELIDTGVDEKTLKEIEQSILANPGVTALHCLRTRLMSGDIFVDVHVQVNPYLTVSEGHNISQKVHYNLLAQFKQIKDVTVHIDPEEDGLAELCKDLANRNDLSSEFATAWAGLTGADAIIDLRLHYLSGKISVEIYLPLNILEEIDNAEELTRTYLQAVAHVPNIHQIQVYFR